MTTSHSHKNNDACTCVVGAECIDRPVHLSER